VKIDAFLTEPDLRTVGEIAARYEDAGFDGVLLGETKGDPFLPLTLAAEHTSAITVGTGIAVALPRSPMHLANVGYDLHRFSGGRHILGLGSQVRAHVERRFSAAFSPPAPRMAELVAAIRAVWASWEQGEPLRFRGDYYSLTLMTPFFQPHPSEWGTPPIYLAAVGDVMTETAGLVADGVFLHPFSTPTYIETRSLPALARGSARGPDPQRRVAVAASVIVATGETEQQLAEQTAQAREQIAFYASTPGYRAVLETHGWGALQEDLAALAAERRWSEMSAAVDDVVLDAFCVRGERRHVAEEIVRRYASLVDRISFYTPGSAVDPTQWAALAADVRALAGDHLEMATS
jgi:probable F420-dependent oxidoreductase